MKRKRYRIFTFSIWLFISLLLLQLFLPRTYPVSPLHKRASIQYWKLQTGSTIGYTLIKAKGSKQSCPVIYLHGGPGGHITDRDILILSKLSDDGYNVYLYDQVGSGYSGRLENIEDYTVDRHLRDLNEIMQKTGASKVIFIAQSWGAILAVFFVTRYPEKVEKIIFTSPGPVFPVRQELRNVKAPDSLHLKDPIYTNAIGNGKANNIRTQAMAYFARTFHMQIASDKEADAFQELLDYEVNKSTVCDTTNMLKPQPGGGFYAQVMTFQDLKSMADPRPALKYNNTPVLILKGQCDNQKWGFTREYLELFSNHQLIVVPGAGHFIAVEQPVVYIQAIKEFINKPAHDSDFQK